MLTVIHRDALGRKFTREVRLQDTLSLREVARALRISLARAYQLADDGTLRTHRTRGVRVARLRDVLSLARARGVDVGSAGGTWLI